MKRYFSAFLILVFTLLPVFHSFASLATPSKAAPRRNIASESDWIEDESEIMTIVDLMNAGARSSLGSITNTVPLSSSVNVGFRYYNMSGDLKTVPGVFLRDDGYFSLSRPSDFSSLDRISVRIYSRGLPPTGKYNLKYDFTSNTGGFTYSRVRLGSSRSINNATQEYFLGDGSSFTQASGDILVDTNVDLSSVVSYLNLNFYFSKAPVFPYGGYVKIQFSPLSSDAEVEFSTPGASSADKTQQMQDNVNNISSGVQAMGDTLKEIVQTISNQLAALWDQMFNLMHVPHLKNDDKNTDRIVNALGDEITVQIENDDKIADDIMNNDDKNTDTIVDGFDNSGMNSNNDKLNNSLTEYDTAEDKIVDSISGYLDDFTMPSYSQAPPGVLIACVYFGNYLQRLFEGMGAFNFPITLSLTMVFVLMLIGYHRFRS